MNKYNNISQLSKIHKIRHSKYINVPVNFKYLTQVYVQ